MPEIAMNLVIVLVAQVALVFCQNGHYWPNGYNRLSRSRTWSYSPIKSGRSFQSQSAPTTYSNGPSFQSQPGLSTYSSPSSRFSQNGQQSPALFSRQQTQPSSRWQQPSPAPQPKYRSFSSPRNSIYKSDRKRLSVKGDRFPSYADRCGNCAGEPVSEVCGSDGKTYKNSCELTNISCKKYWDLREVSKGACSSECPGVNLGMYTGWGLSRASNNGYCHHDFFRCCKAARKTGLPDSQIRSCCQKRADKCFAFVAEKPWRSGIVKYGKWCRGPQCRLQNSSSAILLNQPSVLVSYLFWVTRKCKFISLSIQL